MKKNNLIWSGVPSRLYLEFPSSEFEKLDNVVYTVGLDSNGRFFLSKNSDGFDFDYKIYGLERDLINRVVKTYKATKKGNLGILLNGLKGTGKTVTSKIISNELNQPVILVTHSTNGIGNFINSIPQDITVFVDEYEKIFAESTALLTIMDGALNSEFRRVFVLTTNKLYIDENMIERPSRIRYLKKFENLKITIVEEIIDDVLEHKKFKKDCLNFISNLEIITVDIVKTVISEVNIHNEAPSVFQNVFNVKKLKGKFNVSIREADGRLTEIAKSVNIYPKPTYNDNIVDYNFQIDNRPIGKISRVINWTTIEVMPHEDDKGQDIGFEGAIILKIEDADMINYTYSGHGYENPMLTKEVSDFTKNIIAAIEKSEEEEEENQEILGDEVTVLK